jgi:phosphate transport system substrate-binding protein
LPSEAALLSGAYPLARRLSLVLAHDKGRPVPQRVRAFVSYLLSPEGQQIVARDGTYYPLEPGQARAALARLEAGR